ncbi:MAG: hypothetical protein WAM91_12165 [Candidatus Acidiferrales bacterium]
MTDYRTEDDSPDDGLPEEGKPEDAPQENGSPIQVGLRKWIIGGLVLAIIIGLYWRLHTSTHVLGEAYVADQSVTLRTTLAQVHQRAGDAHWGDQVEILNRSGADTLVRTPAGLEGWIDSHALIDAATWQREVQLQSTSHAIPLQATGHTKVFTNVHLYAGRDATRIYQLTGGVTLAIVGRAAVEVPKTPGGSGTVLQAPANEKKKGDASKRESPKYEEWLLVYPLPARPTPASADSAPLAPSSQPAGGPQAAPSANPENPSAQAKEGDLVMGRAPTQRQSAGALAVPPLAGWVIARFVELDLPETLRDYATSAGMRPVAWFVLNYASDPDIAGGKPQYLMAGNHSGPGVGFGGPNGIAGMDSQTCDFNSLRVYTWGEKRHRYETAFVESNLCGYFPIRASKQPRTGDPEFRFTALESNGAKLERVYAMHQTSVRRLREGESTKAPARASKSKSH